MLYIQCTYSLFIDIKHILDAHETVQNIPLNIYDLI